MRIQIAMSTIQTWKFKLSKFSNLGNKSLDINIRDVLTMAVAHIASSLDTPDHHLVMCQHLIQLKYGTLRGD